MRNPFKFGREVSGYQFYDRTADSESLIRKLVDGTTNIVLFAPRRYGKTSLVMKVLERLSVAEGIKGLCFDMTRVPTLERFCEEYANAVYGLIGGRRELVHRLGEFLVHLNPTISFSEKGIPTIAFGYGARMTATSIAEVLDLPEKLAQDCACGPLVVAFDEFQEVAELSKEMPLEKIFRSCIQRHQNVRYVFLGSKTHLMKRMFGDGMRPFYNSALPMPLGKPPAAESLDFLVTHFRDAGIGLGTAEAEKILSASENIPYYLQAIAALTFEEVTGANRDEVRSEDIEAAIDTLVGVNAELYDERLRNLSNSQRLLLEALASEPTGEFGEEYRTRHSLPVSSTLHTSLKGLQESGVIDSAEVYRLSDPFFVRYILRSPTRLFA